VESRKSRCPSSPKYFLYASSPGQDAGSSGYRQRSGKVIARCPGRLQEGRRPRSGAAPLTRSRRHS
jgi:hypothetical protein